MKLRTSQWGKLLFLSHYLTVIAKEKGFKIDDIIVEPFVKFGYALYDENPSDFFAEEEKNIIYYGDLKTTTDSIIYFGINDGSREEPRYIGKDYTGLFRSFRSNKNELRYTFNGYRITLPKTNEEYRH